MTPAQVNAQIDQQIAQNGIGAITAPILNGLLHAIVGLFGTGGSGPSVAAVLAALEQQVPGGAAMLEQAVPPDPSNLINIHYYHVPFMTTNGVLYSFIASVFPQLSMPTLVAAANLIAV